jgi:hypothetical protein
VVEVVETPPQQAPQMLVEQAAAVTVVEMELPQLPEAQILAVVVGVDTAQPEQPETVLRAAPA